MGDLPVHKWPYDLRNACQLLLEVQREHLLVRKPSQAMPYVNSYHLSRETRVLLTHLYATANDRHFSMSMSLLFNVSTIVY